MLAFTVNAMKNSSISSTSKSALSSPEPSKQTFNTSFLLSSTSKPEKLLVSPEEIVIVSNEVWTFDLGGDADTEYRSIDIKRIRETIKWLNKHHFDWRGLIPMGLAEDATNKNIY